MIEAVSGQALDAFFAANITGPLGMDSTTASMTDAQRANSAPVHVRAEDGSWTATDIDWAQEPDHWGGGHFLYSTPRDYLLLQRMLLGGGALGGTRILERTTVDAAFTNQIGELDFPPAISTARPELSADVNLGPNLKWGLGLLLNETRQSRMRAAGSGAWAGLFNTHFWVDPGTRVHRRDLQLFQVYLHFERALYASL